MSFTDTMAGLSNGLVYSAIAVYALALLAYSAEAASRASRRQAALIPHPVGRAAPEPTSSPAPGWPLRVGAVGTSLTVLGFLLNLGGVVTRGIAAQRPPWGNMYEFAIVCALAAGGAYLYFLSRRPVRDFGVWVVAVILLALGLAVTVLYTSVDALVPVLNSYWLVIHVAAAITAGGIFTVGAVATTLYLVKTRAEKRAALQEGQEGTAVRGRYAAGLPSSSTLQEVAHAAHMFAFPIWTFAVLAGAIWAENSWGRYWGWDPKETWAFITWVLYAAYLHAESTSGWRGVRSSWFALTGYLAFLFNFFGVNMWITGLHSYAGV